MSDPQFARRLLSQARLYVLIDGRGSDAELAELACQLVQAGVDVLQLRDKSLSDRRLLQRARSLRRATAGGTTLLIVNDRPDVALLADADGVHVGQEELNLVDVRPLVGGQMLIGVSTHDVNQAREAAAAGADYIGCGPTFASQTKRFAEFPGLEFLRRVSREIQVPAFAIGGISAVNVSQVLATGFRRVAVSHAVVGTADPAAAARDLLSVLNHADTPID